MPVLRIFSGHCRMTWRYLQPEFTFVILIRKTHYDMLEVKPTATKAEIRIAYVKLCKKYHPDVNGNNPDSHKKFVALQNAYTVLSQERSRQMYDSEIKRNNMRRNDECNTQNRKYNTYSNINTNFHRETKSKRKRNPEKKNNDAGKKYESLVHITDLFGPIAEKFWQDVLMLNLVVTVLCFVMTICFLFTKVVWILKKHEQKQHEASKVKHADSKVKRIVLQEYQCFQHDKLRDISRTALYGMLKNSRKPTN